MGYLSLLPWEQNTEKLIPATKMTHRKTQKWWVTHHNPAFDTRHLTHTHLAWQDKSTNTQVGEEGLTPRPGYPLPDTRHLIDTRLDMTQQQRRHNRWVGKVGALVRAPHPGTRHLIFIRRVPYHDTRHLVDTLRTLDPDIRHLINTRRVPGKREAADHPCAIRPALGWDEEGRGGEAFFSLIFSSSSHRSPALRPSVRPFAPAQHW